MKPLKVVVLLISALALSACGVKNRPSNNDVTSQSVPVEHSAVSEAIGPSGGVVKDEEENVTISIPQGALQEDTNISAQYIEEPSYLEANPSMNFLGAVEFGPSGTTFDKPVEVSLQLTDTPKNNKISIFCYSEEYDIWDYVTDASVNNNIAIFNISHFSKYKALDISMEMLMKFNDLVRQAQATGQSDSWIHENFKNYLINEEHVMDIYSYFGGYWYEPCGLIIGGNYHINGKEGDPNELTELIGETNKVGNTYGLCHDGQLIVDSKTYKKITGQPKEGQETISVNVGVYYKMIKPDIDLTASKKKLNKGENATINIRCHYVNATNYFDEYKDLEMSNYMLTIAKPTNFTTDKSAVLTDDEGLASFVITALENNKAETITVNFDVAGDFGTHAEGNITLNSDGGKTISGHIEEKISFEHTYSASNVGLVQKGTFTLTISYDLEGQLTESDGAVVGALSYKNVDANISSTPSEMYNLDHPSDHAYYNVFEEITSATPYSPSFSVVGSVGTNDVCSIDTVDDASLISLAGTGMYWPDYGREHGGTFAFTINIKVGAPLLLDFALSNGEHTDVSNSFKDTIDAFTVGNGKIMEPLSNNSIPVIVSNQVEITTQTITVI